MCWLPPKLLGQWPLGRRWGRALWPCTLPPFLSSVGAPEILRPLPAQFQSAQVSPNESQQQEMARQAKKSSNSPKEGEGTMSNFSKGVCKRALGGRTPCRQAHRTLLCGSPLFLASVCGDKVSRNCGVEGWTHTFRLGCPGLQLPGTDSR